MLLLVAPTERKVRIEVGYGLEGVLPDAIAKVIIEEYMVPQLRAGRIDAAVRAGVEQIGEVISGRDGEVRRILQARAAPARRSVAIVAACGLEDHSAALHRRSDVHPRRLLGIFLPVAGDAGAGIRPARLVARLVDRDRWRIRSSSSSSSGSSSSSSNSSDSFSGGGGSSGGGGASGSW